MVCLSQRPASLLKKRLWRRCYPLNFAKFPGTVFLKEQLCWVLLKLANPLTSVCLLVFFCDYRKGFSTQTALVWLIEKWKHQLNKNGFAGAMLMDFSKTFDTINYDLLIVKLHAYVFGENGLNLVYSKE